jgi:excisionase family DNA binding protein
MNQKSGLLFLRIPEVAERLALGRSTVYKLIQSGEIPTVRIGGAVRVPVDGLEDWARRQWETPDLAPAA